MPIFLGVWAPESGCCWWIQLLNRTLHTHFRPCCNPVVSPLIFGSPTGIGQRSHRSQQGAFYSDIGTKDSSYLTCTCLQKRISIPVFRVKSVTETSWCISHALDTENANTTPLCLSKIRFCFIKKQTFLCFHVCLFGWFFLQERQSNWKKEG